MDTEKELKKTIFEPLYSPVLEADCALGDPSVAIEHWVEGGKPCPKCNEGTLKLRSSKFGKFYACSCFPKCDYKESIKN